MAKEKGKNMVGTLARNKRARFNYQLHESFEAGLVLEGWEVKGIMAGNAQLIDSHVVIRRGEPWLVNCHITPTANVDPARSYNPRRSRKLLLHAKELRKLVGKVKQTGLTIVALDLHRKHGKLKAEIALAKGKKQHDKRQTLRERDARRRRAP